MSLHEVGLDIVRRLVVLWELRRDRLSVGLEFHEGIDIVSETANHVLLEEQVISSR